MKNIEVLEKPISEEANMFGCCFMVYAFLWGG